MEYSNKIRRLHEIRLNVSELENQIVEFPMSKYRKFNPYFLIISPTPLFLKKKNLIKQRFYRPKSLKIEQVILFLPQ